LQTDFFPLLSAKCKDRSEAATEDRDCDNVLAGRAYRTPQGQCQMSIEHCWNDEWQGKP